MEISDAEFRKRIKAGIAFLDKKKGKRWRKKINADLLDMEHGNKCILGQTDSSYGMHKKRLGLNNKRAQQFGFFIISNNVYERETAYARLTLFWKEALCWL